MLVGIGPAQCFESWVEPASLIWLRHELLESGQQLAALTWVPLRSSLQLLVITQGVGR